MRSSDLWTVFGLLLTIVGSFGLWLVPVDVAPVMLALVVVGWSSAVFSSFHTN